MIPIYKPFLPKSSLKYAHEALDSGWISCIGKYTSMVQEKLQDILGIRHALLVSNGTAACHLLAKVLVFKYNIKKVIVPGNVYVACYNSMLMDKDLNLISIDADISTWNVDNFLLEKAIKQHPDSAVLIVHNMGNVINVPSLKREYPNTIFIEDACEALFGEYENQYAGTASACSAISFFGNKSLTSGQGGAVLTNDSSIMELITKIHAQGMTDKRFVHDTLGYNYRMTNIESAILWGQLELYDEILEMKNSIFNRYHKAFSNVDGIYIPVIEKHTLPANWMFGIRIENQNYDDMETYFKNRQIEIRPMFFSIDSHAHLKNHSLVSYGSNNIGKKLNKECIILPSFPELTENEQSYIIETVLNLVR